MIPEIETGIKNRYKMFGYSAGQYGEDPNMCFVYFSTAGHLFSRENKRNLQAVQDIFLLTGSPACGFQTACLFHAAENTADQMTCFCRIRTAEHCEQIIILLQYKGKTGK